MTERNIRRSKAARRTHEHPSHEDYLAKWRAEAAVLRRHKAYVEGAALCEEMLNDLQRVLEGEASQSLNLQEAASESGYSPDHLGKLVREGKLPNAGRLNAPLIRKKDLPRKASRGLRPARSSLTLLGASPGQIARDIVEGASR